MVDAAADVRAARPARRWLFLAQLSIGALVLAIVWSRLRADWARVDWSAVSFGSRSGLLGAAVLSAPAVLLAFAVLIETWRRVLTAWGGNLRWLDAAHIWFVSNLGRWIPGKVWQVGAMAALAERAGISGIAATGASLVVNLVNLVAGGAVVVAASAGGSDVLASSGVGTRTVAVGVVVLLVALAATPWMIPRAVSLSARALGRGDTAVRVPASSLVVAFVGCSAGWLLYGIGFWALSSALGARISMGPVAAIAVYAASYLFGYLMLFAPGGLVFREAMLVTTMTQLHLAGATDAAVLAVLSRIWITIIEVVPGLLFLFRRPPAATPPR